MNKTLDNPVVFYCKECEAIVQGKKIGKKYNYQCATCGSKKVAYGTEKSIYSFYKIKSD